MNRHFVSEIWIFFVGPFLGATVAAGLYHLLKAVGYETANPGQDDDGLETYRIIQTPARPVRPVRSGTSLSISNGTNYNNYLQDLTSPLPTRIGPNMKF